MRFGCLDNRKIFQRRWLHAVDELGKLIEFSESLCEI